MRRWQAVAVAVAAGAMVLGACGSSTKKASTSGGTTTTAGSAYGATPTTASSTTAAASTSGAALSAVTNTKLGKQIVVNASGKTVYMYMPDGASKTSTVPAGIKPNWPAVTTTAASPTVGTGLDQSKVAVDMQADGTSQVAYGGHLLYTFSGDTAPGDANGQGLGGIWFAISPAGTQIT